MKINGRSLLSPQLSGFQSPLLTPEVLDGLAKGCFENGGDAQNDFPLIVQEAKTLSLSHTHTHTHTNFQCLVYKMSTSKYLETSRSI